MEQVKLLALLGHQQLQDSLGQVRAMGPCWVLGQVMGPCWDLVQVMVPCLALAMELDRLVLAKDPVQGKDSVQGSVLWRQGQVLDQAWGWLVQEKMEVQVRAEVQEQAQDQQAQQMVQQVPLQLEMLQQVLLGWPRRRWSVRQFLDCFPCCAN